MDRLKWALARLLNWVTALLLFGGIGLTGTGAVVIVRPDLPPTRGQGILLFLAGGLLLAILLASAVLTSLLRRPPVPLDPLVELPASPGAAPAPPPPPQAHPQRPPPPRPARSMGAEFQVVRKDKKRRG